MTVWTGINSEYDYLTLQYSRNENVILQYMYVDFEALYPGNLGANREQMNINMITEKDIFDMFTYEGNDITKVSSQIFNGIPFYIIDGELNIKNGQVNVTMKYRMFITLYEGYLHTLNYIGQLEGIEYDEMTSLMNSVSLTNYDHKATEQFLAFSSKNASSTSTSPLLTLILNNEFGTLALFILMSLLGTIFFYSGPFIALRLFVFKHTIERRKAILYVVPYTIIVSIIFTILSSAYGTRPSGGAPIIWGIFSVYVLSGKKKKNIDKADIEPEN